MDLRPGYKQTEIGLIPETWSPKTIGDIAEFQGGTQPPRSTFIFSYRTGYVRLIQIRDYKSDEFRTYIPIELARNRCSETDIMIGRYGPPVFQILRGLAGSYNVALIKASPKAGVDHQYLYYILKQERLFRLIDGLSQRSSGQTGIEMPVLREYPVALPCIEEQVRIATALSDVDKLLDEITRLIAKKRDLRIAMMQGLLTGRVRLPGFTTHWKEKRLGDCVVFLKNGVQSRAQLTLDDVVRYLHYGDIHVAQSRRLDLRTTDMPRLPTMEAARLSRLEDGDLVFVDASEDLSGVGKSLEIVGAEGIEAVAGQHTIAARFDKDVLADGFKGYLQHIPAFTAHLRRLAAGTKVYATNRKHIASAEILLPEPDEQRAIVRVLSDMDAEITALEARLEKTRALKQGMMQALLTGRVRLPVQGEALDALEVAHA